MRGAGACFELFGFDVMLDHDARPWLIEVNVSPDLASSSPLDTALKVSLALQSLALQSHVRPTSTFSRLVTCRVACWPRAGKQGALATDLLHLVGIQAPPEVYEAAAAAAVPASTARPTGWFDAITPTPTPVSSAHRPVSSARPRPSSPAHGAPAKERQPWPALGSLSVSDVDLEILTESEEEWARASNTGFRRIFPPIAAAEQKRLSRLFSPRSHADTLLAAYLSSDTMASQLRQTCLAGCRQRARDVARNEEEQSIALSC